MNWWIVTGAVFGVTEYALNILALENVVYRINDQGVKEFNYKGIINYLKAPLMLGTEQCKVVWGLGSNLPFMTRVNMLGLNWIFIIVYYSYVGYILSQL